MCSMPGFRDLIDDSCDYFNDYFLDGKIWSFGIKYADQPTYNWGHRVIHKGTYAIVYDPETESWESRIEVPSLNDEENCEEALFVRNNALYIFLYKQYGCFEPVGLYKWSTFERKWHQCEVSLSGSSIASVSEGRADITVADDLPSASQVYFILRHGNSVVYHLDLETGHLTRRYPILKERLFGGSGSPILAAYHDSKIYFFYAVMGCNFRWEAQDLVIINAETGEPEDTRISGESPNFGYTGTKYTALRKNGTWLHATGSRQVGMCGSEFDGACYIIPFEEPKWEKLDVTVVGGREDEEPVRFEKHLAFDVENDVLYVAGPDDVQKLQI